MRACAVPPVLPANLPPQWKSFDFFEVAHVSLPDQDTRQLLESSDISSVCAGSDSLFLGSRDGIVNIVGKSWKVLRRFQAHESGGITHMHQVEGTSLLVTVAVRPPSPSSAAEDAKY